MSDVTTIDITVDELTMPDIIEIGGVDEFLPDLVEVSTGIPGSPGPPGPPGILRVNHGADPSVARPETAIVLWVGSVTPTNRDETVDLIAWTP